MDHTSDAPAPAPTRATRREWWGLALLVLPMLMLSSDLTVLFFALPTLSADLQPSANQTLWIVHVYGFLIAGFLITMGRLGDRVGPRRLLLIGSAAFGALSVVAAFSPTAEVLIAARALLGIAGATLMPSLFSLLRRMFDDDRQRRLAIAIMFSAFSVGGAIGPLLGGALLEYFWWGSAFLINVPPMLLLVLLGRALLPESPDRITVRLDLPSVALSVAGMLGLVYGLQDLAAGQESGADATLTSLIAIVGGLAVLTFFVRRQRRLPEPLLDLDLIANRRVSAALLTLLLVGVGVVGAFYLFTQHLQWVADLSPLRAGLWTLPYITVNILGALAAPSLASRRRPAVVIAGGLLIAAAGAGLVAIAAGSEAPASTLALAIAVVGLGQGLAMALVSDLIITSAPPEQTGSASAAQEVGGELGAALGIAAGGAVSIVTYRAAMDAASLSGVPPEALDAAGSSVHAGVAAAEGLGSRHSALLAIVRDAATEGLQMYATIAAVLLLAASALVVAALVRRRPER